MHQGCSGAAEWMRCSKCRPALACDKMKLLPCIIGLTRSRCLPSLATCWCACQVVVEAEAYSNAPGLLKRGLAELLQHLLATFSTILKEQLPGEALRLGSSSTSRMATGPKDCCCILCILLTSLIPALLLREHPV